jgi:hypothetical protein
VVPGQQPLRQRQQDKKADRQQDKEAEIKGRECPHSHQPDCSGVGRELQVPLCPHH